MGWSWARTSDLQRIYDRLRKRSLRKKDAYQQVMFSAKYGLVSDEVVDAVFEDRISFYGLKIQDDVAHAAYVRGVRDALDALEAE